MPTHNNFITFQFTTELVTHNVGDTAATIYKNKITRLCLAVEKEGGEIFHVPCHWRPLGVCSWHVADDGNQD